MKDEMFIFKKNALLANLCEEYKGKWNACRGDKEKLVRLVLKEQSAPYFADFCYNGKGLSKDYCKREFADYINGRVFMDCDGVEGYSYAMFIDTLKDVNLGIDVAQMLWCDIQVAIPPTKAPTMYISNKSTVRIVCGGFNTPRIYLFDESKVILEDVDENSRVLIYRYSDKAEVEQDKFCLGKVKVFDKELRL